MDLTNLNRDKKDRRKSAPDLSTMIYGKVPPQAKDLEEAVLGAILTEGIYKTIDSNPFDLVSEILQPEAFYVDSHQRIFKAMHSLASKSRPIDMLTVVEELRSREELDLVGGPYYVSKLTEKVVSAANIETHSRIILQKYIQRELIRISGEIISEAYEDSADPFELLDYAGERLNSVGQALSVGDMVSIDNVLVQAVKKIEEWRHQKLDVTGIPSGFPMLDRATRGWQDGDLIIIAARPSVGKTALALSILRAAANHFLIRAKGESVAMWSLEMKAVMLVLRMLAAESKEILHKIQTGRLEEWEMKNIYSRGVQVLSRYGILFDDKSGLTILKLRAKARKLKRQNKLGLIVVDYLQLMKSDNRKGTREQEISDISRSLKELAQELQVPIIALSQLNREVEKRTGPSRKPMVSDIRESGAIEQDADVIMLLWGPSEEEIAEDAALVNRRYLRIAKQRNGMLITVDLEFKDEIQFFSQLENFNNTGNWRPVNDFSESNSAKMFIQPGSKLNDQEDEDPF